MASVSHSPSPRATPRAASFAVYATGPVAIAGIWYLRSAGLLAPTSLGTLAVILLGGSIANLAASLWLRAAPDNVVRVHTRVAASVLNTALITYAVGWGSVLVVAYAVGSAELLRTAGTRTTRPNLWWNFGALAAGEIAVAAGWAPSMVSPALSHAIAITAACCVAVVTVTLGQAAAATERAEKELTSRAEHFEALIAHASDLIGVLAPDGTITSVSPSVTPMLGYEPGEVTGGPITSYLSPDVAAGVERLLASLGDRTGEPVTLELALRHRDGSERLVVATLIVPAPDWDGHVVFNVHDVTTQRDLEGRLRHDARHDALTGLLNRKAFGEVCDRVTHRATRSDAVVGLLYIDLDGFKQINDNYGHDAGDRVLVEAGRRIAGCLRRGETLARLGGDEFAVLVADAAGQRAVELAESALAALGRPFDGFPPETRIGASIGIALRTEAGIEISTLLQAADAAMYEAKRNGRSRWELDDERPTVVGL